MRRCNAMWGLILVLAGCGLTATAQTEQVEVERLREDVRMLRARVAELEQQLPRAPQATESPAPVRSANATPPKHDSTAQLARRVVQEEMVRKPDASGAGSTLEIKPVDLALLRGTQRSHQLILRARFPETGEPSARLIVEGFATGGGYEELDSIVLKIGERGVRLPVVDYESQMRRLTGRLRKRIDNETLVVSLDAAALEAMAGASSLRLELGGVLLGVEKSGLLTVLGFVQEVRERLSKP